MKDKVFEETSVDISPSVYSDELDFSPVLSDLQDKYKASGKPIEVDFRKIVSFNQGVDRATHLIHSYPAKLILNIPHFFVNCESIATSGDLVLDPFCGSGTVLLESILSGKKAVGVDANPLARLITKVKNTPLEFSILEPMLTDIVDGSKRTRSYFQPQQILDWSYWYSERVRRQLARIANVVNRLPSSDEKHFFQVCLSVCSRKTSLADPRVSVPVRLNPKRYKGKKRREVSDKILALESANVFERFYSISSSNISRIGELCEVVSSESLVGVFEDAKHLDEISDNSVDLIVTSPPYTGAQKYIRSSSLSLGWLELCPDASLRNLERRNIGREHYSVDEYPSLMRVSVKSARPLLKEIYAKNPLRAHIAANYLDEMYLALSECYRVLKRGRSFVLIVGNNMVCGHTFETSRYLKEMCEDIGFKVNLELRDHIRSRGLMTKRNKTASTITCEWILVFSK